MTKFRRCEIRSISKPCFKMGDRLYDLLVGDNMPISDDGDYPVVIAVEFSRVKALLHIMGYTAVGSSLEDNPYINHPDYHEWRDEAKDVLATEGLSAVLQLVEDYKSVYDKGERVFYYYLDQE